MRLHIVRLCSLLILGGILAGCNSEKKTVEKTLRSYFTAYYSERTERAYDYLSAEDKAALPIGEYFKEWGPEAPCYSPRHTFSPKIAKYLMENEDVKRKVAVNDGIFNAWLSEHFLQKIGEIEITGKEARVKVELTNPVVPPSAFEYINSFNGGEKKPPQEIVAQLKVDYAGVVRSTSVVADCRLVLEDGQWMIFKGLAKREAGK